MNKKIIVIVGLILVALIFFGLKKTSDKEVTNSSAMVGPLQTPPTNSGNKNTPSPDQRNLPADKIEVIHFHTTHQCWSCITVGEYALKTIKEKFPDEYASGKITFKDVNGELGENQEMVVKYQAGGSSLFVNAIRSDKDDIAEDTAVWRLVGNESQFISYFENKLNTLLGK